MESRHGNSFGMQVLGWVCGCLHAGRYRVSCITKHLGIFRKLEGRIAQTLGNSCPNLRELIPKPQGTQLQIFWDLKTKKAANKNNNHHLPVLKMAFSSVPPFFLVWNTSDVSYVGAVPRYCLTYPYLNLSHFQPQQQQARFNFDAADPGRMCFFMYVSIKSQWCNF